MVFCIVINRLRLTQNFTKLFFNVHLDVFEIIKTMQYKESIYKKKLFA